MATITYANTFASNTTAIGSQVYANFVAVSTVVNGQLDQTNFTTMTGAVSWSVITNVLAISIASSGTAGVLSISSTGIQGASTSIFRLTSGAAQATGDAGVYWDFTHAGSTIPLFKAANAGTNAVAELTTSGLLAASKATLQVTASSATAQTTGQAVAEVDSLHAGSTIPMLGMKNAGTGDFVKFSDNSSNTKYEIDSNGSVVAAAEPPSGNLLYNGGFDVWQRGTAFSIGASATAYTADRWYVKNLIAGGSISCSRVAGTGAASKYAHRAIIAVSGSSASHFEMYQVLENADLLRFYNKTCSASASILALGNVTQVGIQFFYATSEVKLTTAIGSESLVTVNAATFSLGKIVAQALGTAMTTSGVVGMRLRATAVSSGNLGDAGNGFYVEQAQMNVGNVPGTFQRKFLSTQGEVQACQRFYEKSYSYDIAPAAATTTGLAFTGPNSTGGAINIAGHVQFAAEKRTAATLAYYDGAGNASKYSSFTTGGMAQTNNVAAISGSTAGTRGFWFYVALGANLTGAIHWTADAEI